MRQMGRDEHRIYFIGYFDGQNTMVVQSRDIATLPLWAVKMGIPGILVPGVYYRDADTWVFDRALGETPLPGSRRDAKATQPMRKAVLDMIVSAGPSGVQRQSVIALISKLKPAASLLAAERTTSRYLKSFVKLGLSEALRDGKHTIYTMRVRS